VYGIAAYSIPAIGEASDSLLGAAGRAQTNAYNVAYDYNNDSQIGASDALYILKLVVSGSSTCPAGKICDIDGSGVVTDADAQKLLTMIIQQSFPTTSPPPAPPTAPSTVSVRSVSNSVAVEAGQGSNDDLGTFTVRYDVTAVNGDVYIPKAVNAGGLKSATSTLVFVDRQGIRVSKGVVASMVNVTSPTLTANGNYLIKNGSTARFEVTIMVQLPAAGTAGQYRATLVSFPYGASDKVIDRIFTASSTMIQTAYQALN
jgi:hypothetical protein